MLSKAEKEKFLKALEEDREFRYAVAGLLGYGELLDRMNSVIEELGRIASRLEEHSRRIEGLERRLEEQNKILMRHAEILEEHSRRIESLERRVEELARRLEEQNKILMRHAEILEEHSRRIESLERSMRRLETMVLAVGNRWGIVAENLFRESMRWVLEEVLGVYSVERWVYNDGEGIVYGRPSVVEVDVVIKDGRHILVEVKSHVDASDVAELYRIGLLYKRVTGVEPRLMVITPSASKKALELGRELGVEVRVAP